MMNTMWKSPSVGAGLLAITLFLGSSQCFAQVHRSAAQSHRPASADSAKDLSGLIQAMRAQNTRLRLLLAERDRQLTTVKSQLQRSSESQRITDSSGIYPLFIATP